jgi:hypothetical protein
MRYLVIANSRAPDLAAGKLRASLPPGSRVIVLSTRLSHAAEVNDVLYLPIRWSINGHGDSLWRGYQAGKKCLGAMLGVSQARALGGSDDVFQNILAADPDVIDVRGLGSNTHRFVTWLGEKLPGRHIVASDVDVPSGDSTLWRSYSAAETVSIVLPVFNGGRYLRLAIESCRDQTHQNFELIIVDDCSTDDTWSIVCEYAASDSRVIPVRNAVNLGLPESLNVGFERARGSLLTWTSDDNIYDPTAVQYMVQQFCTFPELGFVYCGMRIIDEAGSVTAIAPAEPPAALYRWNSVGACFMYRRHVMEVVGRYRPKYRLVEDYDYWTRVCTLVPAAHLTDLFYAYRKHDASLTSRHKSEWVALNEKMRRENLSSKRVMTRGFTVPFKMRNVPELHKWP